MALRLKPPSPSATTPLGGAQAATRLWTFETLAQADPATLENVLLTGTAPDLKQLNGYIYCGWNHYCNKCLVNVLENPIGCYELSRYNGDYEKMIGEIMSVFQPSGFD